MRSIFEICPLYLIIIDLNRDERVEGRCGSDVLVLMMMDAPRSLICASEINKGE